MIVEALAWGDPVGAGVNGAQLCTLSAVVKFDTSVSGYLVANEYLTARLGGLLGLPVPPAALVRRDDGEIGFVSLYVGKRGEASPPVIAQDLVDDHPDLAACIVAFDSWILNDDRHPSNIAYSRAGAIDPFIFDHDRALLGTARGSGTTFMKRSADKVCGGRHCLAERLVDAVPLVHAVEKLRNLHAPLIAAICHDAERLGLIDREEAEGVVEFLEARRGILTDLVASVARNIPQLALPL